MFPVEFLYRLASPRHLKWKGNFRTIEEVIPTGEWRLRLHKMSIKFDVTLTEVKNGTTRKSRSKSKGLNTMLLLEISLI